MPPSRKLQAFTLAADVRKILRDHSRKTGEPMSRIVDTIVRRTFGLPEPVPLVPPDPLAATGTDGDQ